jgi:hypothetical protein
MGFEKAGMKAGNWDPCMAAMKVLLMVVERALTTVESKDSRKAGILAV